MDYNESFSIAIKNNELIAFLRGEAPYKIEASQYAPGSEPTDIGKVLSKGIYKYYLDTPTIKENLENALIVMLDESNYDIYTVMLYIMSQLFKEKNGLSPFKLDINSILPKLQITLKKHKEEFMHGLKYPDGYENKEVWNEIERFNKVCQQEYNLSLL